MKIHPQQPTRPPSQAQTQRRKPPAAFESHIRSNKQSQYVSEIILTANRASINIFLFKDLPLRNKEHRKCVTIIVFRNVSTSKILFTQIGYGCLYFDNSLCFMFLLTSFLGFLLSELLHAFY